MKTTQLSFLVVLLSGVLFSPGCASHTTQNIEHFTVRRTEGFTSYSRDGKSWYPLFNDMIYDSGVIVKTFSKSRIDLTFAEKPERDSAPKFTPVPPKRLRIFENTSVKIDRAEVETKWPWNHWEGTKLKEALRLYLYAGTILGSTSSSAQDSIYQITFTNGAITFSPNSIYRFNADGKLYVLSGAANLFLADKNNTTLELTRHQIYDPAVAAVRPMTSQEVVTLSRIQAPFETGFPIDAPRPPPRPTPGMVGALRKF